MRNRNFLTTSLLAVALALGCAGAAGAANPPANPPAKSKKAETEPAGNVVPYDELHLHIGEHVTVHTTFKTTRTGVLTQVSNSQVTLGIESSGGTTELTMPKNTIVSVTLAGGPAPAPQPGTPSAKKN